MEIVIILLVIAFLPTIIGFGKFLGLIGSQVFRFILMYGALPALVLLSVYLKTLK